MSTHGVWSFRTETGYARLANGALHFSSDIQSYSRGQLAKLKHASRWEQLLLIFTPVAFVRLLYDSVGILITSSATSTVRSGEFFGVLLMVAGVVGVLSLILYRSIRSSAKIPLADITLVQITHEDRELTIRYERDMETEENTTVARTDADLQDAIEMLELKGVNVARNPSYERN